MKSVELKSNSGGVLCASAAMAAVTAAAAAPAPVRRDDLPGPGAAGEGG